MRATPLDLATRRHKALSHPVRVRILALLRAKELCVCEINAVIGLAPSTVSAHLRELRTSGLVAERKAGRWVHYRLAEGDPAANTVMAALWPALEGDPLLADDARVLGRLDEMPVEALCRPDFDPVALRTSCCGATTEPTRRERRHA